MATITTSRAPMHLWIVGALSLLWNGFGCYDYLMTRLRNTEYLKSMMPGTDPQAVLGYIDSFPLYAQIGWGLGVWGGLAGSALLLMRHRWATIAFALSFIGSILGLGYQLMHPSSIASMHEGAGGVIPYVIIGVALLLTLYARAQAAKGVLR